jgi:3-mercaptopyruvate sulfurtransferase SseA
MNARTTAVLILSLLAVVVPVRAQDAEDTSSPALRIAYEKFKPLYDARKIVVIDTRDQASFDMGHIPGSRLIPADEIGDHVMELRRLGRPIVTYCS